jgi:hypothetical protein
LLYLLQRDIRSEVVDHRCLLGLRRVLAYWHCVQEWHLRVVVRTPKLDWFVDIDPRHLELALLLELGQAPRLLQLLLSGLSLGFLTLGVGKACSTLLEHLLLILVHVDRVWAAWLGLRVGIDFTRSQVSRVVDIVVKVLALGLVKKFLILLDALISGPAAYDGCYCPPLAR